MTPQAWGDRLDAPAALEHAGVGQAALAQGPADQHIARAGGVAEPLTGCGNDLELGLHAASQRREVEHHRVEQHRRGHRHPARLIRPQLLQEQVGLFHRDRLGVRVVVGVAGVRIVAVAVIVVVAVGAFVGVGVGVATTAAGVFGVLTVEVRIGVSIAVRVDVLLVSGVWAHGFGGKR